MEDTIYCFKLVTGEEIISRLTPALDYMEPSTDTFSLDNPRSIMPVNDRLSLGLALIGANPDKPIILKKSAIVCYTANVRDALKTAYLSAISNIVLPGKQNLMG